MVLPLLGLLGLGVGSVALPYVRNFQNNTMRRNDQRIRAGLLAGVDPDDTDAQADALFRGGLLDPDQYMTTQQAGDELASLDRYRTGSLANDTARVGIAQQAADLDMLASVPTPSGPVNLNTAWGALVGGESSGNPAAVSNKGASGLGQIMPGNIVPWAREMLPEQVAGLSDDEVRQRYATDAGFQDALGRGKFGQLVQQHGLTDAYSIWHSGVPLAQAIREGRHDGNVSTVDYVRSMMSGYAQREGEVRQQWAQDSIDALGTEGEKRLTENPFTPPSVRDSVIGNILERQKPRQSLLNDAGFMSKLVLEQAPAALELGEQIEGVQGALEYVRDTNAGTRVFTPGETARYETAFRSNMINYLRADYEAGALQASDTEFFEKLTGEPFSMRNLTDAELSRGVELLNQMKADLRNTYTVLPSLLDPSTYGGLPIDMDAINARLTPMQFPSGVIRDDGSRRLAPVPGTGAARTPQRRLTPQEEREMRELATQPTGN